MEDVELAGDIGPAEADEDAECGGDVDGLRLLEEAQREVAARAAEDRATREIAAREEERAVEAALRVAEEHQLGAVERDVLAGARGSRGHLGMRRREEASLLHDVDRRLSIAGAGGEDVVEVEEEQLDGGLALRIVLGGRAGPRAVEDLIDAHRGEAARRERLRRAVVDVGAVVSAGAVRVEHDRVAGGGDRALRGVGDGEREAKVEHALQLRLAALDHEAAPVCRLAERHRARLVVGRRTVRAFVDDHVGRRLLLHPCRRGGRGDIRDDVIHRRERLLGGIVGGEDREVDDIRGGDAGGGQLVNRRRVKVVRGTRTIGGGLSLEDLLEIGARSDRRARERSHLVRHDDRVAGLRAERPPQHRHDGERVRRPVDAFVLLPVDLREVALAVLG